MDWNQLLPYLVPALVVVLLARRLIRNQARRVRVGMLFILPVVISLAVIATLYAAPMPAPLLLWGIGFVVALALGATAGFFTAHHQEFSIDSEGQVTAKATPFGTLLFLGLFAVRFGLKYVTTGGDPYAVPHIHPNGGVIGWTDVGLMFATGLVFARAITTWVHARPLIDAHKAQTAIAASAPRLSGEPPPGNT